MTNKTHKKQTKSEFLKDIGEDVTVHSTSNGYDLGNQTITLGDVIRALVNYC